MTIRYRGRPEPASDPRLDDEIRLAWADRARSGGYRPTMTWVRERLRAKGLAVGSVRMEAAIRRLLAAGDLPELPRTPHQLGEAARRDRDRLAREAGVTAARIRHERTHHPRPEPQSPPPAAGPRAWVKEHLDRERRIRSWRR